MQFRKLFFSLCCMVALGASLAACSEDEELFDDSGSKVTLPVHRAFILNEGTQGANNATLSFMHRMAMRILSKIFFILRIRQN